MVDEERLVGMGVYLFASVLDPLLLALCHDQSYTRLEVRSVSRIKFCIEANLELGAASCCDAYEYRIEVNHQEKIRTDERHPLVQFLPTAPSFANRIRQTRWL